MKFLELPMLNDTFVSVNPLSIAYVEPCPETHCIIHFNGNPKSLKIKMALIPLQTMINEALEAAKTV